MTESCSVRFLTAMEKGMVFAVITLEAMIFSVTRLENTDHCFD